MEMLLRYKKILFALIAVSIPLIILVMTEILLHWVMPSLQSPVATEVVYDNITWYQVNRGYLKTYFPIHSQLIPEFKPGIFRKHKSDSLFRIIALGGSSMFGTPYQMTSNIPGILRRQLRHLYPDREIEVINFAASAINSQVIRQFAPKLLEFDPDLIIIYMGHNEYYGPDGVGATVAEKRIPALLSLKYSLRKLSLFQLLRNWLESLSSGTDHQPERNLMKEVSQGSLVELDSGDSRRIFSYFHSNLVQIIRIFQQEKIPVIVSDVAANLQFPPFAYPSQISGRPTDQVVRETEKFWAEGDFYGALQKLSEFLRQDSSHAMINFLIGKTYLLSGQPEPALKYFRRALNDDLLKFRAPDRVNEIIWAVGQEMDIPVISSQRTVAGLSPDGITGFDLFWEHLHMKTEGYYAVANLFLNKILELNLIPPLLPSREQLPLNKESLNICWLDVAYADLSIANLTGKWPFQNFHPENRYYTKAEPELQDVVNKIFQKEVTWDEGCYRTAAYFEKAGRWDEAAVTYRAIVEEYPFNFYAHYQLGRLYKDQGRLDEAVNHYLISVRSNPDYPYSQLELGMVQINRGLFDHAIYHLNKALTLMVSGENKALKANLYYGLAAAYANKGEFDQAINFAGQALTLLPQYPAARELYSRLQQHITNKKSEKK